MEGARNYFPFTECSLVVKIKIFISKIRKPSKKSLSQSYGKSHFKFLGSDLDPTRLRDGA